MDAVGMALAIRLLLTRTSITTALALRHAVPESFFIRIGIRPPMALHGAGCSPPSDNAARWNPVGTAEFHT